MRALSLLIYFGAVVPVLAGCGLLFPYVDPYSGLPYTDPYFSEPTVPKEYGRGSATIELTRADGTETISLTSVESGSAYDAMFGANVTWQNGEGWTVMVTAFSGSAMPGLLMPGVSSGDVMINRVDGHEFWTAGSYTSWNGGNGCTVDIWDLSETKLAGRANCTKLRWTDGINPMFDSPSYIDGQEPFDASITFEAFPSAAPSGSSS